MPKQRKYTQKQRLSIVTKLVDSGKRTKAVYAEIKMHYRNSSTETRRLMDEIVPDEIIKQIKEELKICNEPSSANIKNAKVLVVDGKKYLIDNSITVPLTYADYLKSDDWKRIANRLKENRPYCSVCRSTERLEVHHLTYKRLGMELDVDLVVLCHECHRKVHRNQLAILALDNEQIELFSSLLPTLREQCKSLSNDVLVLRYTKEQMQEFLSVPI